MTRITGNSLIATPCCRSIYSTPRYGSVNFSASAYWTDGYKESTLMPSGGGLRKCKCGEFYLLADAIAMGLAADSDTPPAQFILAADLADATYARDHVHLAGNGAEEVRMWLVAMGAAGSTAFVPRLYEPVSDWYTGIGLGHWEC